MPAKKYYTIWKGKKTGVYDSWDECKPLVEGYEGARYKSFSSRQHAEAALKGDYSDYVTSSKKVTTSGRAGDNPLIKKPSISVDGAWNTVSGDCEYQGVDTESGKVLFHGGVYRDGTNNIVEYLAVVHALAYCEAHGLSDMPIYSDSRTALAWVRKQHPNTKIAPTQHNQQLFDLLGRATKWLETHTYKNPLLKWETEKWGEIPADFGRK